MTPTLATIVQAVNAAVPGLRVEVSACRSIAGTNPPRWSQHAFDNAADLFGPAADLERAYRFLAANRGRLGVDELCYRGRGGCTTAHNDHVHVSGHPKGTGNPPCASGSSRPPAGGAPASPVQFPILPPTPFVGPLDDLAGKAGEVADDLAAVRLYARLMLRFLADPANWRRIGIAAAGVLLGLIGVWLIIRDTAAGDAIGAAIGGAAGGPAGAAIGAAA